MKSRIHAYFAATVVAVTFTIHGVAFADDSVASPAEKNTDRWDRTFTLWGHLGSGPFGVLGATLDVAPSRYLSFEAGVGLTFYGPMVGFSPRLRLPITNGFAISGGPSISVVNYEADDDCFMCIDRQYDGPYRSWKPAYIGGVTAGIEGRTALGFSWRVYIGTGRVLNVSDRQCTGRDSEPCTGGEIDFPFFGTAFGYAFE